MFDYRALLEIQLSVDFLRVVQYVNILGKMEESTQSRVFKRGSVGLQVTLHFSSNFTRQIP